MNTKATTVEVIQWFHELPEEIRYRYSSQWMEDETDISNAKLAALLTDDKRHSETFIKSFRSYDLKKKRLKSITRPARGFTHDDVHQICNGINLNRKKTGRSDRVSANEFYHRAKEQLYKKPQASLVITQPVKSANITNKKMWLAMFLLLILVVILATVLWFLQVSDPTAPKENSQSLKQYLPGTVIQLLDQPEHYLSAQLCYPALKPAIETSAIVSKSQLQSMRVPTADHKTILLPDLPVNDGVLKLSTVSFEGLNRWSIPKGMINLGMSDTCMASMQQVLDFGNQIAGYGIIKQTFVADILRFEFDFTEQATAAQISQISDKISAYYDGAAVNAINGQYTIFGPVTVAFISQPMSARVSKE